LTTTSFGDRLPELDLVSVQEAGLSGLQDTQILTWAAQEGRILLTHGVSTMKTYALSRVSAGLSMPGIFIASQHSAIGRAIESILLLAECGLPGEWESQIRRLQLETPK